MKFRWYVMPIVLAAGLLLQPGCGNTPDALPSSDVEEVDDLMDGTAVPEPDGSLPDGGTPDGDGTGGDGTGGDGTEGDGTEAPPA